ncbi:hypothetical protein V501_04611 [Pseudogymnoascus sp. VKM F-4519 (FW-2642)]|nr:hypothetical protein V501_04611 [Pseudogymnoascus sp. VKM F-4519 (FW-2642)]
MPRVKCCRFPAVLAESADSVATTYLGSNRHLRIETCNTVHPSPVYSVSPDTATLHYTAHRIPTTLITRSLHVTPTSPPLHAPARILTTTRNPAAARADDGDLRRRRYSQHAGYEHGSTAAITSGPPALTASGP